MVDGAADVTRQGGDRVPGRLTDLAARRNPIDRRDDLVVPAEDLAGFGVEEVERGGHHVDGQRTGEVPPDLRPPRGASPPTNRPASPRPRR